HALPFMAVTAPEKEERKTPLELSLTDPLRDLTRKERRNLLIVSLGAILIAKAGLVPTEISALGIKLTSANKSAFLYVLAAVNIYYLLQFFVYASRDLVTWNVTMWSTAIDSATEYLSEESKKVRAEIERRVKEDEEFRKWHVVYEQELERVARSVIPFMLPGTGRRRFRHITIWAVSIFDFVLPVAVAAYAIAVAVRAAQLSRHTIVLRVPTLGRVR